MEAIKYFTKNTDYEVLTIDGFKNFEGISLQNNTTYNVEFTNDISIKCTLNHKFFSIDRNKWIEVKNFKKGELFKTKNGNTRFIKKKKLDKNSVFDLINVEDTSSFIANNLETHNCIHLDEFAHIQNNIAEEFFTSVYPTISSGKTTKCVIVSTPKGYNFFHKLWKEAEKGMNGFVPIYVNWSKHPSRDNEWRDKMIAELGEEKFAQEFDASFIGSSNTLIGSIYLRQLASDTPIKESKQLKVYSDPQLEHIYLIVADPSRGTGNDNSAFIVFDISEFPIKIAAVYKDPNISPMVFPSVLEKMGKSYNNAHILVESNDIGSQVTDILWNELEYENTVIATKDQIGIRTTRTVKQAGCSNFKDMVENQKLLINDAWLISEISTFIQKKSSYEADAGATDDLVMCCVLLGFYTGLNDFKNITDVNLREAMRQQKAEMIENEIVPFGFIVGESEIGFSDSLKRFKDQFGDVWILDENYKSPY
jgi:hypothetical protein